MKRYTVLGLKEIGEKFKMDYAAVSQACKRFEGLIERDKEVLEMKAKVERDLRGGKVET